MINNKTPNKAIIILQYFFLIAIFLHSIYAIFYINWLFIIFTIVSAIAIYIFIPFNKIEEKYKKIEAFSKKVKESKYSGLLSIVDKIIITTAIVFFSYQMYVYFIS